MGHRETLLVAVLAATLPATAIAAPAVPTQQAKENAVALADRGYEFYAAGHYQQAIQAFMLAYRHVRAPTFLLWIARSRTHLGRLVDAKKAYQQIVAEDLGPNPPSPFVEAQEQARKELAELLPRVPSVRITIGGAPPKGVRLTVDGVAVSPAARRLFDPGRHTIALEAHGHASVLREINLSEGATEEVSLSPGAPLAPPDAGPRPILVGAGIGAGVAAVGVGITLMVMAADREAERDALCASHCSSEATRRDWQYLESQRAALTNAGAWNFIGATAMGLGTVAYMLANVGDDASTHIAATVQVRGDGPGLALATTW